MRNSTYFVYTEDQIQEFERRYIEQQELRFREYFVGSKNDQLIDNQKTLKVSSRVVSAGFLTLD